MSDFDPLALLAPRRRPRVTIFEGDALEILPAFPPDAAHAVVTSPPYWQVHDYKVPPSVWPTVTYTPQTGCEPITVEPWVGALGQEETPAAYVGHLVHVFRLLKRPLRADGTLWLNLGEKYVTSRGGHRAHGLPYKSLGGIPWRVALALQADGWLLRSDVVWWKRNAAPETVHDRPTNAHEYVFLFTRAEFCFFDHVAVREAGREPGKTRNVRTVWDVPTRAFKGAHYTTFPPALAARPIAAGTSPAGSCGTCGAAFERMTDRDRAYGVGPQPAEGPEVGGHGLARSTRAARAAGGTHASPFPEFVTLGWRTTCPHPIAAGVPCRVLDPFAGAGPVGIEAAAQGRDAFLCELSPRSAKLAADRLRAEVALVADVTHLQGVATRGGFGVLRGHEGWCDERENGCGETALPGRFYCSAHEWPRDVQRPREDEPRGGASD